MTTVLRLNIYSYALDALKVASVYCVDAESAQPYPQLVRSLAGAGAEGSGGWLAAQLTYNLRAKVMELKWATKYEDWTDGYASLTFLVLNNY